MVKLPKAKDEENEGVENDSKFKWPSLKVCGDPEDETLEWLEFVQDMFDKLILTVIISGLIYFVNYSLENKAFKPFTYWVLVVAITSTGDIIDDFGANVPENKCIRLIYFNIITGLSCLVLSIFSFVKCT